MTVDSHSAQAILARILEHGSPEKVAALLRARPPAAEPLPARIPAGNDPSAEGIARRRALLTAAGISTERVAGPTMEAARDDASNSIENLVGSARVPLGVIGPLRVNGANAHGDFYVPLATTEGALVASCHRGAHVVSRSGGASVLCLAESVSRAPCFVFDSVVDAGLFLAWVLPRVDSLQAIVETTSKHCRLGGIRTCILGKEIYLIFDFQTGDASGQNMVTLATEALGSHLVKHAPVKPRHWFVEGNLSGDKKAAMISFIHARGKKMVAETVLERRVIRRFLHTEPEQMKTYWEISVLGGIQSGSIGAQGHYANPLTALFIACGQDVACVAEASVGVTRMDITDSGDLYVSVSLPNVIVGTVGGGTGTPTAQECLGMLGCVGTGKARKFAEICAATVLAGEVSIVAAMAAGAFARDQVAYGRGQAGGS